MRWRRGSLSLLVAAALAVGVACSEPAETGGKASTEPPTAHATIATSSGPVETSPLWVADSEDERARGLMGRTTLPRDGGMVFRFPEPTDDGFWMKDTPLPLSIAFWGRDGRILAILDMEPCSKEPCPIYRPGTSYESALEMRRGWFDEHGVEIGDRVELIDEAA